MKSEELKRTIIEGGVDEKLSSLLAVSDPASERARCAAAVDSYVSLYGDGDVHLFSVGGRSEISGNHTDPRS